MFTSKAMHWTNSRYFGLPVPSAIPTMRRTYLPAPSELCNKILALSCRLTSDNALHWTQSKLT